MTDADADPVWLNILYTRRSMVWRVPYFEFARGPAGKSARCLLASSRICSGASPPGGRCGLLRHLKF